jgi:hypothetical protein
VAHAALRRTETARPVDLTVIPGLAFGNFALEGPEVHQPHISSIAIAVHHGHTMEKLVQAWDLLEAAQSRWSLDYCLKATCQRP